MSETDQISNETMNLIAAGEPIAETVELPGVPCPTPEPAPEPTPEVGPTPEAEDYHPRELTLAEARAALARNEAAAPTDPLEISFSDLARRVQIVEGQLAAVLPRLERFFASLKGKAP